MKPKTSNSMGTKTQSQAPKPKSISRQKKRNSGMQRTSVPKSVGMQVTHFPYAVNKGSKPDSIRIRGTELVRNVRATTGLIGERLLSFPLAPESFTDSRLSDFANLYERFLFVKFIISYVPTCGTDKAGQIMIGYDRDINDAPPSETEGGIRSLASYEGTVSTPVYFPIDGHIRLLAHTDPLWTGASADSRFSYQGRVLVYLSGGCAANSDLGQIYMSYDCELSIPQHAEMLTNQAYAAAPKPSSANLMRNNDTGAVQPNTGTKLWYNDLALGKVVMALAPGAYRIARTFINGLGGSYGIASHALKFANAIGQVITPDLFQITKQMTSNDPSAINVEHVIMNTLQPLRMWSEYLPGTNPITELTFTIDEVDSHSYL